MRVKSFASQHGSSMIEVLVTIVIIAFGLLGMAGMQVRLQASEMESYQRSQALLLLSDMASRLALNRNNAASYLVSASSPLGVDAACSTATSTRAQSDLGEWCESLIGAGETMGANAGKVNVGSMVGGRGCIERIGEDYMITVAWQGLTPLTSPGPKIACGKDLYNRSGTPCVNDRCRRTVTTLVGIARL